MHGFSTLYLHLFVETVHLTEDRFSREAALDHSPVNRPPYPFQAAVRCREVRRTAAETEMGWALWSWRCKGQAVVQCRFAAKCPGPKPDRRAAILAGRRGHPGL
jgi:hypothetical protein